MGRGQVLELQLTQYRAYVEADYLLIPLKGCGAYGVTHGIGKPPPEVLTQLQIIGVEYEPTIPVRLGLCELLVYFSTRLAVSCLRRMRFSLLSLLNSSRSSVRSPSRSPSSISCCLIHLLKDSLDIPSSSAIFGLDFFLPEER